MPWVAGSIAGSGVLSAVTGLLGSHTAASAANQAAQLAQQRYQQTRTDLAPYNATGQAALGGLNALATGSPYGGGPNYVQQASGMLPGTMTQAQLAAMPGYQWMMQQGQEQVAAANAARGLGVSGAQLKGAGTYATGLADQTYQQAFQQQQQQFSDVLNLNTAQQGNLLNQYNRLYQNAALGANAAAQVGTQGTALANQAGQDISGAGMANAAGLMGVGNAATQGVNNYLAYQNYQRQMANQTGGYQVNYNDQGF